jgi:hypothetical protein
MRSAATVRPLIKEGFAAEDASAGNTALISALRFGGDFPQRVRGLPTYRPATRRRLQPAAGRAAGPVDSQGGHRRAGTWGGRIGGWTERWIARAQRKADLRAERLRRNEDGVRAGTEPPGLLDRMESWITLFGERSRASALLARAYANERLVNGNWPRLPGRTMARRVLLRHGASGSWTGRYPGLTVSGSPSGSGPPARTCRSMTRPMTRHG